MTVPSRLAQLLIRQTASYLFVTPLPKELKTLEENKQKLAELEDSRPLVIELPKNG